MNIVSAETELFSGEVSLLVAPGAQGELGIKPKHAPLLTNLKPGEVRIKRDGQEDENIFVSGGYLEVQPNVVTILADTAVRAHDIDEAAAIEAKQRAEEALANRKSDMDVAHAQAELAIAAAQLELLRKLRR
ncbi:ATP synthase F1, epsilon subunit [gamma proteobacterium HTCC5015]|nr:ATP synthase F1, epsilon subunit [gamma proteobacterium HTCC5015]